ncbi:hypothetical protein GGR57DRAFT_179407 [Xylariaceae sp. FL1272]|nr:hypothetical protein GGR57DRAFT_179407 [Xylariaceae sp. FL1272]
MKTTGIVSALALAGAASASPKVARYATYPTTTIANITVIDTPIVRAARELIEVFIPKQPYLYNHLMRTWLWGSAAFNNNATLKSQIDLEVHAVGTLLHDLGWDMRENSPWVSEDLQFEVDSAIGAYGFIDEFVSTNKCTSAWTPDRKERVWDGITEQANFNYLIGKNINPVWIAQSVFFEFPGPRSPQIADHDYDTILAAYPNDYSFRGSNETFTYLCGKKPEGTYGSFIEQFGTAYVPGYNATGHHSFDVILEGVAAEVAQYPDEDAYSGSELGPGSAPLFG